MMRTKILIQQWPVCRYCASIHMEILRMSQEVSGRTAGTN